MYKNFLNIIILLITCISVYAQTNTELKTRYRIIGKVMEASSDKSVPYAIIQVFNIYKQTETITATDALGDFILYVRTPGSYMLKFNAMGYGTDSLMVEIKETSTNVGQIKLSEGQLLKGVTVTAKRLIMKDEGDRLVYDVTNDPEAKQVKMVDIIKKIPFMTTNTLDGKLKYLDNNISTILIDGKPNEMISGGRQFPMRLIKGDVMSKIEIIMPGTPDNSGDKPIVNIKLARELPNGYATELKGNGNTQNVTGGNIDIITKFDKLYVSLVYGIDYQNKPKLENFTTKENLSEGASLYLQENKSVLWGNNMSQMLGVGTSYQITKKDNISLSLSTNISTSNNYINTLSENYNTQNEIVDYQNSVSINKNSKSPKVNGSIKYCHYLKGGGSMVVSYNMTNSQDNSDYTLLTYKSKLTDPDYQISNGNNSTVDQSATFHFLKKYSIRHLITANLSYTNRDYSNFSEFEYWNYDNQNLETFSYYQKGLKYTQEVYRAYGRYNYIGKKIIVSFNFAVEQMINKGVFHSTENSKLDYNELNLFPSLGINYITKHKYKLSLSYTTRILRPNINYLNPFVDNSDPNNVTMGNPNLNAEYANNFEFKVLKSYGNNVMLEFISSAEFINNAIEKITILNDQNISTTTYDNIENKANYFARMNIMLMPLSWLTIINGGRVQCIKYTNTLTGMKNSITGFGYFGFITANIFKSTNVSGSVNISPQINSVQTTEVKYYTSIGFSLSQTLIKNKFFLTLSIDDPFKNHQYISNVIGNNTFNMTTKREEQGRVLGFRLTWNFGRLREKPSIPGTDVPSDLVRPELPIK